MIRFKQTISTTEVFHFKTSRLGFHFCHPQTLKLFGAGFSSRISISPTIDWPLKFDYSSLNNPLIKKHVPYLVKKHLNVHCIYYNVSFVTENFFWNLSSLVHNLTSFIVYLSLFITFPVLLKNLNNYFFQMACIQVSSYRILMLQ